ncbi:MAG: DsbA family protein, partial [Alphaproteobacteria bacterium]|nr:DsbA family protein [Alphaproteobacteria bacterium]
AMAFATAGSANAQTKTIDLTDLMTPPAEGDVVLGPDTAKVTIVEYLSASCPHCADFYKDVFVQFRKDYVDTGKVKFVFREFPHNDQAMGAFMLARCVAGAKTPTDKVNVTKYLALIDIFFTTQPKWVPDAYNQLKDIGKQAGLSAEDFDKCLKNVDVAKGIMAVRDKADKSYGVTGIPTFFINGKLWDGERTLDALKKYVDPLLA